MYLYKQCIFLGVFAIFGVFKRKKAVLCLAVAFVFMNAVHTNFYMLNHQFLRAKTLIHDVDDDDDLIDLFEDRGILSKLNIWECLKVCFVIIIMILIGVRLLKHEREQNEEREIRYLSWFILAAQFFMLVVYVIQTFFFNCEDISKKSIFISSDSMLNKYGNGTDLDYYCNQGCNCDINIQLSPVCTKEGRRSYFSPCHAGCTSFRSSSDKTVKYVVDNISVYIY